MPVRRRRWSQAPARPERALLETRLPGDLLVHLRTDEALRADIRAADAIWFDVPTGLALDVCGPLGVPRTTFEACLPKFL